MCALAVLVSMPLPAAAQHGGHPPIARRAVVVDTIHGVAVADPYRWMEQMAAPEVRDWLRGQDTHARAWAAAVPERARFRRDIATIASSRRFGAPLRAGGRYYYVEADGSFSRRRLIEDDGRGARRIVLHEDSLPGGATARLGGFVPSPDGRRLAWGLTQGGSAWTTVRFRDLATGRDLSDTLTGQNGTRTGLVWARNGEGVYYERLPLPDPGQELSSTLRGERLWYHRLGTPQSADVLVYDPGHPDLFLGTALSADGCWLVLAVGVGGDPNNRVVVRDLCTPETGFIPLIAEAGAAWGFLGAVGSTLWFQTSADAPRSRITSVDLSRPGRPVWRSVVPESEDVIDPTIGAAFVGGHLIVPYRHDAWMRVRVFRADGVHAYDVRLPKVASIWSGFTGRSDEDEALFVLSDFADPGTVYALDVPGGETRPFRRPELGHDPDDFVTRQVFYRSKDGTRIPMFVSHHRSVRPGPSTPLLMYAYGAFNWSASPWFRPDVTVWMQSGGIFALPNIRGGGEYGRPWHEAGTGRRKQTAIDDVIAAGEFLVQAGWTSRERMAINGGSASGMVAGAVIAQRPDLFAASTIDYPALDMIRFDRFTGGRQWRADFGSTEDPEDFRALLAYSPYHNLRAGTCYPATMVLPGERDETTVPMHAYKFVAALQAAQGCARPVLLRVAWGAGHAAGATLEDSIDNWADQLAFLYRTLRP